MNEFQTAVNVVYSIGTVSLGAGLNLGVRSRTDVKEMKSTAATTTDTTKASVFTFGIPVYFKVAF